MAQFSIDTMETHGCVAGMISAAGFFAREKARGKCTFTTRAGLCNAPAAMKKLFALFLPLLLPLAGCVTSSITNLTASQQPRNPNNLYLIEYEWDTNQQSIRPKSVTPHVVLGFDTYEMRPTPRMTKRWEALIPVPANKDFITYHFKVDYEYNDFGKVGRSSINSPEYRLNIVER